MQAPISSTAPIQPTPSWSNSQKLWQNPCCPPDMVLRVDGQDIPVHKVVLLLASDVLSATFSQLASTHDDEQYVYRNRLDIEGFSRGAVDVLLTHVYGFEFDGAVAEDLDLCFGVFQLAVGFEICSLAECVAGAVTRAMGREVSVEVLDAAVQGWEDSGLSAHDSLVDVERRVAEELWIPS